MAQSESYFCDINHTRPYIDLITVLAAVFVFSTFHHKLRYKLQAVTVLFLLTSVGTMGWH